MSRRDSWQIHFRCRHSSNLPSIHRFLVEPILATPSVSKEVFQCSSFFSLQLSFAPMVHLGVGIERKHDVTIKRLHECDPRQHRVAHSISASIATCHCARSDWSFGRPVMWSAASRNVMSSRPSASAIGSSNLRLQPGERSDISFAPGYPIGAAGLLQAGGSLKRPQGIPLGPPTCGRFSPGLGAMGASAGSGDSTPRRAPARDRPSPVRPRASARQTYSPCLPCTQCSRPRNRRAARSRPSCC